MISKSKLWKYFVNSSFSTARPINSKSQHMIIKKMLETLHNKTEEDFILKGSTRDLWQFDDQQQI